LTTCEPSPTIYLSCPSLPLFHSMSRYSTGVWSKNVCECSFLYAQGVLLLKFRSFNTISVNLMEQGIRSLALLQLIHSNNSELTCDFCSARVSWDNSWEFFERETRLLLSSSDRKSNSPRRIVLHSQCESVVTYLEGLANTRIYWKEL
jgi:hypothetical protein